MATRHLEQATQAARSLQAAKAVSCAAGSGCSFIVAAVMMPSVPSLADHQIAQA
jgi:hypothetical protein